MNDNNNMATIACIGWAVATIGWALYTINVWTKKADNQIENINNGIEKMKEEVNTVGTEDWKEDVFKEV